jgi:hypothetical protein
VSLDQALNAPHGPPVGRAVTGEQLERQILTGCMIRDFDMWRTQIVKHTKEGPTPQLVQEPAEGYEHVFGSIVAGAVYKLEHPHLFSSPSRL